MSPVFNNIFKNIVILVNEDNFYNWKYIFLMASIDPPPHSQPAQLLFGKFIIFNSSQVIYADLFCF